MLFLSFCTPVVGSKNRKMLSGFRKMSFGPMKPFMARRIESTGRIGACVSFAHTVGGFHVVSAAIFCAHTPAATLRRASGPSFKVSRHAPRANFGLPEQARD